MQDAIDRLVRLYGNMCCQGSLELAELELKSELRSQLKLERCAQGFTHAVGNLSLANISLCGQSCPESI